MGMFDTVKCEYPLPDGFKPAENNNFQTKSLECLMDYYKITKDGRLLLQAIMVEDRRMKRGDWHEYLDGDYTGVFNFYTSENGQWHEYKATFIHGQLEKIEIDQKMVDFFNERLAKSKKQTMAD